MRPHKLALSAFFATIVATIAIVSFSPIARAAASDYVMQVFGIGYGGQGTWDYLAFDDVRHRLFVSRGSHVPVFDTATTTTTGDIPATAGVHGIALAQDLGLGFTSNGRDNSVTVFDLATLATKTKIAIPGQIPDAILYEPTTHHVLTFNGKSGDATVIDAKTNAVIATIPLPGTPEFAVADDDGTIYDNIEDKNAIVAIDAKTDAITKTWPLGPCEGPSGLAMDVAHQRLFAVCGNKLMAVVDARSGAVVATIPIGEGSDAAAFDPGTQLAFSSNGRDGTLTVVHEDAPDRYSVAQTVTTQAGARTMAIDRANHTVWLDTAKFQTRPAVAGQPAPRREMIEGSFTLLEVLSKDLQRKLYR